MQGRSLFLAGWLASWWVAAAGLAQDSVDRDYADQLPRIPASEVDLAREQLQLADSRLRLEQVASEPQVQDPVAITFDALGNAYVAQMRGYSERQDQRLGSIVRLSDSDGDGRYDESQTYAEGLRWPTGLLWVFDQLLVADAPDLLLLQDADGDGVAERRQILWTGFGTGNVQQLPNSLQWGPDLRIWGASGGNGGRVRPGPDWANPSLPLALPAARHQPELDLRGHDFSIDPRDWTLRLESGGTQFGMTFDRWGNRYLCSNSDHCQQVLLEAADAERNPFQRVERTRVNIAREGPAAEVFRISPVEPWRKVRTRLRVQGLVPGPIEGGGRAAGYFTSATGLTSYQGDALPDDYRDNLFVGDVGSNLVHRKLLSESGVPREARRAEAGTEFLRSPDNWFRPVQLANAPDGTLWILDMYREVIEHPASLPPLIKRHLDLNAGNRRGRIYRVVAADRAPERRVLPGEEGPQAWCALLAHPNGWHRATASRLLFEALCQSSEADRNRLLQQIRQEGLASPRPEARMAAMRLVSTWQPLELGTWNRLLEDPHPEVRRQTLRRLTEVPGPAWLPALQRRVGDDAQAVRFQLALTLAALPPDQERDQVLLALAGRDGQDPWMRAALGVAAGSAAESLQLAVARQVAAAGEDLPGAEQFLLDLADQVTARHARGPTELSQDSLEALQQTLDQLSGRPLLAGELMARWQRLDTGVLAQLQRQLTAGGNSWQQRVGTITALAAELARDPQQPLARRCRAIGVLQLAPDSEENWSELLEPRQPPAITAAALGLAAHRESPAVGQALIDSLLGLSPRHRDDALQLLLGRPNWTAQLLDWVAANPARTALLGAAVRQRLLRHPDEALRSRAARLWAETAIHDRAQVVQRYQSEMNLAAGNPQQGSQLFDKHCQSCHRLAGRGNEIGPSLAAFANRGVEALVWNILDPGREVDPRFLAYQIALHDGRLMVGLLESETAGSITLRDAAGKAITLRRDEIETIESTSRSLMPDNLDQDLNPAQLSDLITFLLQQSQ